MGTRPEVCGHRGKRQKRRRADQSIDTVSNISCISLRINRPFARSFVFLPSPSWPPLSSHDALTRASSKPGDSPSQIPSPASPRSANRGRSPLVPTSAVRIRPHAISFPTDTPHAAVSSDKSRGMATIVPLPPTATVVGLQPKCSVTNADGLSVKPSPIVTFDGAGPFSSPCVGLDFTVAQRPSTDAVALKYRFRSPSQAQSAHMPLVDVPLTSHRDWTRVRLGATELEYQSSPLSDGSSDTKRAVVRTKMTTTGPSLSSVKVHSVFIVQSSPGSGPQIQHVLPSHPLFHTN